MSIVYELTEVVMEIHQEVLPTLDDEEDEDEEDDD